MSSATPHTDATSRTLADRILSATAANVMKCYQCGKCSAGCPMGGEMPLPPHEIMRYVMTNKPERIFGDESIWLCLTCETCSARCPNGVDPARIIDALRELSVADGFKATPRSVRAFHQAFLDQIRTSGRLYEVGLVVDFKMRSGNLFSDITNAPAMLRRGKLPIMPSRIAGHKDVARIMDRCAKARATTAGGRS